jgi:hypothetical protein
MLAASTRSAAAQLCKRSNGAAIRSLATAARPSTTAVARTATTAASVSLLGSGKQHVRSLTSRRADKVDTDRVRDDMLDTALAWFWKGPSFQARIYLRLKGQAYH